MKGAAMPKAKHRSSQITFAGSLRVRSGGAPLYHFYNLHCEDHRFHSLQTLSHINDDLSNRNYL